MYSWFRNQRFRQSLVRIWGFLSLIFSFSGFPFPFPAVWVALNCLLVLQASKILFSTGFIHPHKPQIGAYPQAEKAIKKGGGGMYPVSMTHESIIFQYLGTFIHSLVSSRNLGFLDMFLFRVHSVYLYKSWVNRCFLSNPELSQLYQFDISSNVKMGGVGG